MTKGLPPLDTPFHMQDPHSCKRCKYSFYAADDPGFRYLRCSHNRYGQQCRFERHETGDCGPAALFWKERGDE